MNEMLTSQRGSFHRDVILSSLVLAFAGLGDALLYSTLPIFGEGRGFSPFEIGLLLSVNKLIRIPGNAWVVFMISKKGTTQAMKISAFIAFLTTLSYGFNISLFFFLLFRIMWGLSYATMRIASLLYAAQASENRFVLFGMIQGIKTAGGVLALYLGAHLVTLFGYQVAFHFLGALTLLSIVLASYLPSSDRCLQVPRLSHIFRLKPPRLLMFFSALIIDGILVVTLSKLFPAKNDLELVALVAGYLLFRKFCSTVLSILSGWFSDHFGLGRIFNSSLLLLLIGSGLIAAGNIHLGITLAFISNSVIVAMLPALALQTNSADKLSTLSGISTWRDLGAAVGVLGGIPLFVILGRQTLWTIGFITLSICALVLLKRMQVYKEKEAHLS